MKRSLLHYVACQADSHYPMDLYVFREKTQVLSGVLFCSKCFRWYPIKNGLPEILPDCLRDLAVERSFLRNWNMLLPKKVLYLGKPFNLEKER